MFYILVNVLTVHNLFVLIAVNLLRQHIFRSHLFWQKTSERIYFFAQLIYIMAKTWSVQQAKSFWPKRKFYRVTNDPDEGEKTLAYQFSLQERKEKDEHAKAEYLAKRTLSLERQDVFGLSIK